MLMSFSTRPPLHFCEHPLPPPYPRLIPPTPPTAAPNPNLSSIPRRPLLSTPASLPPPSPHLLSFSIVAAPAAHPLGGADPTEAPEQQAGAALASAPRRPCRPPPPSPHLLSSTDAAPQPTLSEVWIRLRRCHTRI
jgi:hypothetical protein